MQLIPVQAVPNQVLQVQLASQACAIEIVQYSYGMFMNLYVGNQLVVAGVICENLNRIVRSLYLGFVGDLVFYDSQATSPGTGEDPVYTGLGTRFLLIYLEETDLDGTG